MVFETECYQQLKSDLSISNSNLVALIEDAIANIKIKADLTIVHSDYQPLKVSSQYQEYLQDISVEERDRYLVNQLQQYLYAIFSGKIKPNANPSSSNSVRGLNLQNEIINDSNSWHQTKFFARLTECNHSQGYKDSGWLLVENERDGQYCQVSKDELTLYVDSQKHFPKSHTQLQVGDTVSITMPPNLVERGLYVAVGNAGSVGKLPLSQESAILQLYFNVDAKTSLLLLDNLTQQLNSCKIPFDFEIPYSEADFERLDAPVLEFMKADWLKVKAIVEDIYSRNITSFQSQIPFFCQQLDIGLGLAEKPNSVLGNNWKNLGKKICFEIAISIVKLNNKCNIS